MATIDQKTGVYAGLVSDKIPAAGTLTEKPINFVAKQFGDAEPPPPTIPTDDFFAFADDNGSQLRYFGVDFETQTYTQYGAVTAGGKTLMGDDTYLFLSVGTKEIQQIGWRGNCLSLEFAADHTGANDPKSGTHLKDYPFVIISGTEAFGDGFRAVEHVADAPFSYPTQYGRTAPNDRWQGCFDYRETNQGEREYGDALALVPSLSGDRISTYRVTGGFLELVAQTSEIFFPSITSSPSCNRETGEICMAYDNDIFRVYRVNPDLSINWINELTPVTSPDAYIITDNGFVMTAEGDTVRTYERLDFITLSAPIDSYTLPVGVGNANANFYISPRTGRIWLVPVTPSCGLHAFTVNDLGEIIFDIRIPNTSAFISGAQGNPIWFFEDALPVRGNGFTGIKAKLWECWEFNEVGSVTRVGAMGNYDLPVLTGTVNSRAGTIGNAADFDGASALGTADDVPYEMQIVGSFSMCFDAVVDAIPGTSGDQFFFFRGRDTGAIDKDNSEIDMGCYVSDTGILSFFIAIGFTVYTVEATSVGAITPSQKYHVYVEYNRADQTIGIRVDGGTLETVSALGNMNIWTDTRFRVGRQSLDGNADRNKYLDGSLDQFYWFWDVLDTGEQDFMYNSGNSRAFSEL